MIVQGLNMRGIGTQTLFSDNELEMRVVPTQLGNEAFGGIAFTNFVARAILLHNRLGHERNDFPHVWVDNRGASHLMMIGHRARCGGPCVDMTHSESSWRKNTPCPRAFQMREGMD